MTKPALLSKPATAYELRQEVVKGRVLRYLHEERQRLFIQTNSSSTGTRDPKQPIQYRIPLVFGEQEYLCTIVRSAEGASLQLQECGARNPLLSSDGIEELWALEAIEEECDRRATPHMKKGLPTSSRENRLSYLESMLGFTTLLD